MPTTSADQITVARTARFPVSAPAIPQVCTTAQGFGGDTQIALAQGFCAIDRITVGDLVQTLDHGPQPVRSVSRQLVAGYGATAPILFEAGSLGNERAILVSPEQRVLIRDWRAELWLGCEEVLVAAKDLVNGRDVRVVEGGVTSSVQITFDETQIIYAGGCTFECCAHGEASDAPAIRMVAAFSEAACLMAA